MKRLIMMLAMVSLLWAGLLGTTKALSKSEQPTLTLKFLEDVWVNENGFVCAYEKDLFYFNFDSILTNCKVTKDGIQGSNGMIIEEQLVKYTVEVLSQDSIKINGITAYRWNSEVAKGYLSKIKDTFQGEWVMSDNLGTNELPITITDSKFIGIDTENMDKDEISYEFVRSAIFFKELDEELGMRVQMVDQDCFVVSSVLSTVSFYRKDSKAYENYQKTKDEILVGTWIYANSDKTKSEKWEITKDQMICTPFTKNAKSKVLSYQIKREEGDFNLIVGDKSYQVFSLFHSILLNSEDENSAFLLSYDSKEGKHALENIEILHKNGKMEKRSSN